MLLVLTAILFAVLKVDDLHSWLPKVVSNSEQTPSADKAIADHSSTSPESRFANTVEPKVPSKELADTKSKPVENSPHKSTDRSLQDKDRQEAANSATDGMKSDGNTALNHSEKHSQTDTKTVVDNDKNPEDLNGKEPPSVATAEGMRHEWISARKAYWQQDLERSEQFYLTLRESSPNDPDIAGELGNLYYARGDLQKAVETYYETGLLLRDANRIQEARMLANEIHRLDSAMASKLWNQL